MAINKTKIFSKKRFWAGVLLAQFLLFYIFSKIDFIIRLAESFFEKQKAIHQSLFSKFPFSIGDVFYVLLATLLIYLIFKIITKHGQRNGVRILIILNVFYFTYQIFWGLMYFQKPISEKLPKHEIKLDDAKALSLIYLEKCKSTREQVQEDRNGVFKIYDKNLVEDEILKNQKQLPKFLNSKTGSNINSFKPSIFKGIMSYTGIYGYYNPFTAEAQFNPNLPSSQLPFTVAHESAHQLGYAREQEANFIGYLIGVNSKNLDLRYSTEYYVLKSLLNLIVEQDEKFVKAVIAQYSPGMKRDRLYEKMFRYRHSGILDSFFGLTNNLFLKTNQQEGSITYSYFNDLLIKYEKEYNKKKNRI